MRQKEKGVENSKEAVNKHRTVAGRGEKKGGGGGGGGASWDYLR